MVTASREAGRINRQGMKKPAQIEAAVLASGHEVVAQEIIKAVGVELAGENVVEKIAPGLAMKETDDPMGQFAVIFAEDAMHVAGGVLNNELGLFLVIEPADAFEDMAQRPVAKIMKQRPAAQAAASDSSMAVESLSWPSICLAISMTPRLWL